MEPDHLSKRYRRKRSAEETTNSRSKRQVPHIIYPEILVIVDYDGYRLHGGNNADVSITICDAALKSNHIYVILYFLG